MKQRKSIGIWLFVLVVGVLSLLLLHTYWQYLLFALLFAVLCYPQQQKLSKQVSSSVSALIIVLAVLFILVVPSLYVIASSVYQAPAAYAVAIEALDKPSVREFLGFTQEQVRDLAITAGDKLKANVLTNASAYLGRVSDVVLGLFIMFIVLFFLLRDGKRFYETLMQELPIHQKQSEQFLQEMRNIVKAVVLGQLVTAVVQGILGGVMFWVFGIPNPLFWGVIMMLLSIVPVLGPFLVYVPAGFYLVGQERYIAGVAVMLIGLFVISTIDNIIRPYIAHKTTAIHPLTVILGVVGGIKLWGLIGFILGPLVLAAFIALYELAVREYTHPMRGK